MAVVWMAFPTFSPRKTEKVRYAGRPVEHYLTFKNDADKQKYQGRSKIPMETFHEMYFDNKVEVNGDMLEMLEYRHDWASFRFTLSLYKFFLFGFLPEMLLHSRSQGISLPH